MLKLELEYLVMFPGYKCDQMGGFSICLVVFGFFSDPSLHLEPMIAR